MPLLRADSQSQQCYGAGGITQRARAGLVVSMWFSNPRDSAGESTQLMPVCNSKVRSRCLCETLPEAERGVEHSWQDITKDSPHPAPRHHARLAVTCPRPSPAPAAAFGTPSTCHHAASRYQHFQSELVFPLFPFSTPSQHPCSSQPLCLPTRTLLGYSQGSRAMN